MFIVELQFDGGDDRLAKRPAHREKLAALSAAGKVRLAGPYDDDSGALLLFDVESLSELDAILADDPYYFAEGVTILRKQHWKPLAL